MLRKDPLLLKAPDGHCGNRQKPPELDRVNPAVLEKVFAEFGPRLDCPPRFGCVFVVQFSRFPVEVSG
jgi:hypothetical protein